MIELELLRFRLDRLTGDAVKVGVYLATTKHEDDRAVADARWCRAVAKKIGLAPPGVAKAVKELAKEGIIAFDARRKIATPAISMSQAPLNLALVSSSPSDQHENDAAGRGSGTGDPPWLRGGERSEPKIARARGRASDAAADPHPHRVVTDAFTELYREANGGADPTWDGKAHGQVKSLLKKHPAAEVVRRAEIMFRERRRWPKPPYDLGTLVAHFDKFAVAGGTGGVVGDRHKTGVTYYGEITDG